MHTYLHTYTQIRTNVYSTIHTYKHTAFDGSSLFTSSVNSSRSTNQHSEPHLPVCEPCSWQMATRVKKEKITMLASNHVRYAMRKNKSQFTLSMWARRLRTQCVICLDCCRPRCTAKQCKTCSICRNPSCNKRKCESLITELHPKKRLHSKTDLDTYLCERCRWITCACGNIMPRRTPVSYTHLTLPTILLV